MPHTTSYGMPRTTPLQKDMGLHPYAEQFAQAGMAVLVIDYRGFGGSDGMPRHHISWRKHLEDYQAALDFVASGSLGSTVDASRIALWGVSYSGAHALMTASKEANAGKVSVVIANEPFLTGSGNTGKAFKERGVLKVCRLIFAALLDKVCCMSCLLLECRQDGCHFPEPHHAV